MAMATFTLFACNKEQSMDVADSNAESCAVIKINVNGQAPKSRSVEDGHPGNNGDKVFPKVVSVTVIPYNEYGAKITEIDLDSDQVRNAVYGDVAGGPVGEPAGVLVGLPTGTKKVDVVVNRPSGMNPTGITNINYFNYRSEQADKGDNTPGTADNFERVYLTTEYYGTGCDLGSGTTGANGVPQYEINFSVSPSQARFEIYGGINVATAADWIDGYKSKWKTMTKTAFEAQYKDAFSLTMDVKTGEYTRQQEVNIAGGSTATIEVTFRNAVAGTDDNGFDKSLVYFPKYYWYAVGPGDPSSDAPGNETTEDEINNDPAIGAGWVINADFENNGEIVTWYPNMFYAVDVESIFVNNIKVRSIANDHYQHPWPGSFSATGWPEWYKAYHAGGWHTAGSSPGNTFLCMGNMWDRIATTNNPSTDELEIEYPAIDGSGKDKMSIIIKKAIPLAGKSVYYANDRNLGVATGKAAAYQIYEQKIPATTELDRVTTGLPHIVLKVKAYENAAKYAAGDWVKTKEFITIKAFQQGNNYVTDFRKATIYRVDINELLGSFVGKIPVPGGVHPNDPGTGKPIIPTDPIDPDPEMPGSQLKVKVEVLPWTIQNIKPIV